MVKNSDQQPGIFVLSLDTELAWGNFERVKSRRKRGEMLQTREAIEKLLNLLEKYKLKATWPIVGHLMLEDCHQNNKQIKHPEISRPNYNWHKKDWFEDDPCTNIKEEPLWYGLDIVKKIESCSESQEIGSHSFSHQIFGDEGSYIRQPVGVSRDALLPR